MAGIGMGMHEISVNADQETSQEQLHTDDKYKEQTHWFVKTFDMYGDTVKNNSFRAENLML